MSFSSTLGRKINSLRAAVRRRGFEKRISGLEIGKQVRIYDIVCPLRYDILVRAEFIEFLANNDGLLATAREAILESPAARAYEVWFREVAILRFSPEIYHDGNQVRQRFAIRVEKTKRLWESISLNGFDSAHQIKLRSGKSILEVNGKSVSGPFFAGDGCHRIACLLVMGKKYLEPKEYEVALWPKFQPLDNTALLIDKLPITVSDYLTFISRGYCEGQTLATANEAVAYLEKHDPDRLTELKSILEHDLIRLT